MHRRKKYRKTLHLAKRLLRYVKPYSGRFFEALFFMSLLAIMNAIIMWMPKPIFDHVFRDKNADMIPVVFITILLIALVKGICYYIQSYLSSFVGQKVILDIRNELYSHLQKLSLDYFVKHKTGHVVARITNDVLLLQRIVVTGAQTFIRESLTCFCLMLLMFYLRWEWALIALLVIPGVGFALLNFAKKLRILSRETQMRIADIYSFLHEKIVGVRLIKAFNMEEQEIKKFKSGNSRLFNVVMKAMRVIALQSPIMEVIVTLGMVFILAMGGYSVINGVVSDGTFFAFIAAMASFYAHLRVLAGINRESQEALVAAERIFYVLDSRSFVLEAQDAVDLKHLKDSIIFEHVSFGYSRKVNILERINLKVNKGEVVAFVGVSGSGKTTIANLLARFYDPTKGRIVIDGHDIRNVTLKSLRMQMGIVTQETILFNDTVRDNIAYGELDATQEKIITAAKAADAHGFIMNMPYKYNTVVGERGVTLSGGERQRIAIARAVLKNPPILVLDEATSNLDSESETLIQKAIDELMKNRTVIIITHRLVSLKRVKKIFVIDKNRIIGQGTHVELMKKNVVYRKLYNLQFRD